jgi:hypothetical protein
MAKTNDDLESFLSRLGRPFEQTEEGVFLVSVAPNQPAVALRMAPPVVVMQVPVGELPAPPPVELLLQLLRYNAVDLLHASYGVSDGSIVLAAALEADNLDSNELEAALADIAMALNSHVPVLREMARAPSPTPVH